MSVLDPNDGRRGCFGLPLLSLIAAGLAIASQAFGEAPELPVLGETPFPSETSPTETDVSPVRVKVDSNLNGRTVRRDLRFFIKVEGLSYEPEAATALPANYADGARRPGAGHFHVYGSVNAKGTRRTNVFLGAPAFSQDEKGRLSASVTFPCEGEWLLFVVAQYDDHTPRIPQHPQQWPAIDCVQVFVVDFDPVDTALGVLQRQIRSLRLAQISE